MGHCNGSSAVFSIKDKAQQPYILAPYRYYMDESKELPNFGLPPEPGFA
jgi:hypothetical protein